MHDPTLTSLYLPYDLSAALSPALATRTVRTFVRFLRGPGASLGGETVLVLFEPAELHVYTRDSVVDRFQEFPIAQTSPLRHVRGVMDDRLHLRRTDGTEALVPVGAMMERDELVSFLSALERAQTRVTATTAPSHVPVQAPSHVPAQAPPVAREISSPPLPTSWTTVQGSDAASREALLLALEEPVASFIALLEEHISTLAQTGSTTGATMPLDLYRLRTELAQATGQELVELSRMLREAWSHSAPAAISTGVFRVRLTSAGPNKIQVIKVVREHTGLGLKDSKDLVESDRPIVKQNMLNDEAQRLVQTLREGGATAVIENG